MQIDWDRRKGRRNKLKHNLSFAEASQLFLSGVDYLEIFDEGHSELEERYIAIGPIARGLVVVVWTERVENTVRIISARFATKRERELFRQHINQGS